MKKIISLFSSLLFSCLLFAQSQEQNKNSDLYKNAPEWAKLMYSQNPNVNEVDRLYANYYQIEKYTKSYHTQYYKRWRRAINPFLNDLGYFDSIKKVTAAKFIDSLQAHQVNSTVKSGNNWTAMGPFKSFQPGGLIKSGRQANIYTIARCEAVPNVMYCGTEPGEVYRSSDSGNTWTNVSLTLITAYTPDAVTANAGIHAMAVHPTNPDIVYIGSASEVFKTINGGLTWTVVFDSQVPLNGYLENPAELHIIADNPEIVLVAGKEGIYRTIDGGANWVQVLTNPSFDIKAKIGNPNVLFTVRKNNATNTHQFLISSDAGITWIPQATGWYTSTDPARTVEGARIAVSEADNNRVYAFLIGDSKSGDDGCVGIYRSNDGGLSWVNTMGYDGAPYSNPTHPNLISNDAGTYNQGFYNCAIMASNTNPDQILVGGIGMWRSIDGGQTFECTYNYGCGSFNPMHVDMQDFRAFGNEYWASTDGGMYKSLDFFATQPEFKMDGVRATDFWGFGSGWNNDLLVGGTFHNGTDVFYEGFASGEFLDLDTGEPASGYVYPGNQLRIYDAYGGSKIIPQSFTGAILDAPFEATINEDAWFAESSEMEFHPSCYNHVYKGFQNKLFKSLDGGASFSLVFTASSTTKVLGIEISRTNTNTMYIVIRPNSGSAYLVKTTDDWASNSTISIPAGSNNLALIGLDPENDQVINLAYPRGNDGFKMFKSLNGGATWTNQTSSELNAQNIQAMTCVGGTDGGVYVATNVSCYYKNNSMPNWVIDNVDLPSAIGATGIRPFYRDGKLRMASFGKGIWESELYETPVRPVAKIMVDKLTADQACNNVFYFDDYSMLNHTNATWAWTFQNANIATSSIRNPQVSFNSIGTHRATLTVTDANGVSSSDTLFVSTSNLLYANIQQDFELNLTNPGWFQESNGGCSWEYSDLVGGFGQSTNCMFVNNFSISSPGTYADMIVPINMTGVTLENAMLSFDVAFSMYATNYADSLQVLVSTDCGVNYTVLYNKGGSSLATTASTQNEFFPTASEWRKDSVDLSAYIGNPNVYINFRNINEYGQNLFVDNINLVGNDLKVSDFSLSNPFVYPNPVSNEGKIQVNGPDNSEIIFNLFNSEGKVVAKIMTEFNSEIPLNKYNLNQGTYFYKIVSKEHIYHGKIIVAERK